MMPKYLYFRHNNISCRRQTADKTSLVSCVGFCMSGKMCSVAVSLGAPTPSLRFRSRVGISLVYLHAASVRIFHPAESLCLCDGVHSFTIIIYAADDEQ